MVVVVVVVGTAVVVAFVIFIFPKICFKHLRIYIDDCLILTHLTPIFIKGYLS